MWLTPELPDNIRRQPTWGVEIDWRPKWSIFGVYWIRQSMALYEESWIEKWCPRKGYRRYRASLGLEGF